MKSTGLRSIRILTEAYGTDHKLYDYLYTNSTAEKLQEEISRWNTNQKGFGISVRGSMDILVARVVLIRGGNVNSLLPQNRNMMSSHLCCTVTAPPIFEFLLETCLHNELSKFLSEKQEKTICSWDVVSNKQMIHPVIHITCDVSPYQAYELEYHGFQCPYCQRSTDPFCIRISSLMVLLLDYGTRNQKKRITIGRSSLKNTICACDACVRS